MCCGNKRQQLRPGSSPFRTAAGPGSQNRPAAGTSPVPPETDSASPSSVFFEYVGKTGLTIVSPITGARYRFDKPGDQLPVDARDQTLLLYVPNLRPVRVARNP